MIKNNRLLLAGILAIIAMTFSGCAGGEAPQAKNGDVVRVHYTGKLDDGTVFDSSTGGEPLQFTIGSGQLIPGFEQAVIGLKTGESITVKIPAVEAYGPHQEELVLVIDRTEFPADLEPQIGQQLQMSLADGSPIQVLVTGVSELTVTLDANHPLAGKDLTFDIELVDII